MCIRDRIGSVEKEDTDRAAARGLEPPRPYGVGLGQGAHAASAIDSTTTAAPWPPPTHNVARPSPPPRRRGRGGRAPSRGRQRRRGAVGDRAGVADRDRAVAPVEERLELRELLHR